MRKVVMFLLLMGCVFAAYAEDDEDIIRAKRDTKVPCAQPVYPKQSLENNEEGAVRVALKIDTKGDVVESKIDKGSGYRRLDRATQDALSKCKYKPAYKGETPVESWVKETYKWALDVQIQGTIQASTD